eukprot:c12495_g1_i1.p1 GENE.c12495_g1_i1~~c12495_g1_i1.p1  ORF type:complete len:1006 (-),score=282.13 c12495_g1_i1:1509-4526(-)
MEVAWDMRERDYAGENQKFQSSIPDTLCRLHPLHPNWKFKSDKGQSVTDTAADEPLVFDPLSQPKGAVIDDPLGASFIASGDPLGAGGLADPLRQPKKKIIAAAFVDTATATLDPSEEFVSGPTSGPAALGPWRSKRNYILQTFTVAENVQIKCSFLNANRARDDEGYLGEQIKPRLPAAAGAAGDKKPVVDAKTQRRLEELEDPSKESDREFKMMSMKEYISHLENLNAELKVAWRGEERVKSLRIAIQCAKLLGDTSVAAFYPSMFVLVTEILDTFGQLVYQRIRIRSKELSGVELKDDFTSEDVHPDARETCRNWFFKVASIRELVPRLYVEMALVPCYRFLTTKDHHAILARLGSMMRGVSGTLVSIYLRAYLGRTGAVLSESLSTACGVAPQTDYLVASLFDFLQIFKRMCASEDIRRRLEEHRLTFAEYVRLMSPALEWVMFCAGAHTSKKVYSLLLKQYCDTCNASLVLHAIISSFPPPLIASTAQGLVHLIKDTTTESLAQHWLFGALGDQLNRAGSSVDDDANLTGPVGLTVLNEVWKVVSKYEDIHAYMHCAMPFIVYVLKYRRIKEVNILLTDMIKHVSKEKDVTVVAEELKRIVLSIVEYQKVDFLEILRLGSFQKILDYFRPPQRDEVYKAVLRRVVDSAEEVSADAVLLHTLLHVGRSLHDSLDSLSFSDELRQVSALIQAFISKITFGTDFEQQLNFYLECRAAFTNLHAVKSFLVRSVLSVLMKTLIHVKGRHTKRTAAFAKACLAYTHITIPSLEGVMERLELYLECAQASLLNQFLPQTDTFVKTAISLIPEFANEKIAGRDSNEEKLVRFVQCLVGWLVVVPGHPEHGPFYLSNGLLAVVTDYPWEKPENKLRVLISVLCLFSAYAQKHLPYTVERVVSNDELFAGEETYHSELAPLVTKVTASCLEALKTMENSPAHTLNALCLLNVIVDVMKPTPAMLDIASRLYLAVKAKPAVAVFLTNTRRHIALREDAAPLHQALAKLDPK